MISSLIIPWMRGKPFFVLLFLLFSILLSLYLLLFQQASRFKLTNRVFQPSPPAFLVVTGIVFILLLSFWILYSRVASRLFGRRESEIREQDFLAYLPLLFLSLTPLTLRHFIGADDLQTRLRLFALGIAAAVLYLKVVQIQRWDQTVVPFWKSWNSKFSTLSLRKQTVILFLVSLLIFNAGALLLVSQGINFSGDQPHYLLISHSLLRDGDFELTNNYKQRDYAAFMISEGRIEAHVVPGAKPGSRYSFHSPGVAFLMLPFYAPGGLIKGKAFAFILRLGMSLWGGFLAIQIYLFARSEWRPNKLALRLWFLTSFTTPVFFYSFHIYPEIIVAALSLAVFRILRFSPVSDFKKGIVCGLFLSSFLWFHALKYLALFIPLFIYGLWTLFKKSKSLSSPLVFSAVTAVGIFLYLQFQHALYGTYSLSTVSWAASMTNTSAEVLRFAKSLLFEIPWRDRWQTLAGYFLDQRDGLLFYAPIYFFSLFGAVEMFRRRRNDFWLLLGMTVPYILISALLTQRAGYAPQARPLVAVIWGPAVCLGYFLAHHRKTICSAFFNVAAGLSFLFVVILCLTPFNLYQETTRGELERGGGLFFLLSNLHYQLTDILPSYIKSGEGAWPPNIIWPGVILFLVLLYLLTKRRSLNLNFPSHLLLTCAAVIVFFLGLVLYPRLVLRDPTPTKLSRGERVTFYSLSRSARMVGPGEFRLREDARSYRFYLTRGQAVKELTISLGSLQGHYDFSLRLFDQVLAQGRTDREIQSFIFPSPPRYRLGKQSYYEIVLELGKDAAVRTALNPYSFEISLN